MTDTPHLGLPVLEAAQAQKHVTHNEALTILDALVMLAVIDRDLSAPPVSPAAGDRYLVKSPGSGGFAGKSNQIAHFADGAWFFYPPRIGWTCYVQDEGALLAWDGAAWQPALQVFGGGTGQNLSLLGIGTTADGTNPFSAKLNNALWTAKSVAEGGDGNLRYKLSKESAAKTLSFLLQNNFSGRAEIGLTGDDDFHFKVSANGTSWLDAITIDRSTGKLTLGQGFASPAAARAQVAAASLDALAFNGMQLNGSGSVSQELGTTGATLANNTNKYTADMWEAMYNHGAAGAVVTSGQVAAASFSAALGGYSFGHQIKATTAISSPANGDFARHRHQIEGYRVSRLGWGASGAQPIAIAVQFYAMRTGTQMLRISNAAGSRFYHTNVAVVAGWNFLTKTIPGDTSGTWEKTNLAGLVIEIFGLGKSASPATADAWGATGAVSTSGSDGQNQYSSNNDLTIATGLIVLPGLELPSADRAPLIMRPFDHELMLCKRYYYKITNGPAYLATGQAYSATGSVFPWVHPVQMRAAPSLASSVATAGDLQVFNASGVSQAVTALSATNPGQDTARLDATVASALVAGNATLLRIDTSTAYIAFLARL